jgi:mono/diheme cytochrome c family protein
MKQLLYLAAALALSGAAGTASAANLENGQHLSERWCSECHSVGSSPGKLGQAQSFASIAARQAVTAEMIASFLRMPHATMPNVPLSRNDAQDIAAFIMEMKK